MNPSVAACAMSHESCDLRVDGLRGDRDGHDLLRSLFSVIGRSTRGAFSDTSPVKTGGATRERRWWW
eukprot:4592385-Prymnesium_polylepis.1